MKTTVQDTVSSHANFSFSTIADFDRHIASEIKGYTILDDIIKSLADMLMEDGTNVYDIGCSTGRLIKELALGLSDEIDESRRRHVKFIGFEPNANFHGDHGGLPPNIRILPDKVTQKTKFRNASLILSIFTLQFTPIPYRATIIRNIYDGLTMNGAFIWAEKVYASDAQIESLVNRKHIDFKWQTSSADEILGKDKRLRAIMHPLDLSTNLTMLASAGFTRYEVFWRVNNFVCLIALR